MDIGILAETKKKGRGNQKVEDYIMFQSGVNKNERAKRGVAQSTYKSTIMRLEEMDDRIMTIEIKKRMLLLDMVKKYSLAVIKAYLIYSIHSF